MINESEVAALYTRYGHAIYRRCLHLLGESSEAHEVLQETFCEFMTARTRFLGQSSPFTFLYRIATNLAIDRLRRRKTRGQAVELDEASLDARALTHGDGIGGAANGERAALVTEELLVLTEGLDQDTLCVAVMAHVDGMTQDEIAEALALSRRTVGKRLQKFLSHTAARAQYLGFKRGGQS